MGFDMSSVMHSLESEFKELNQRYSALLNAASQNASGDGPVMDDVTLNRALSDLIERMENKGQQLYLLKRHRKLQEHLSERTPIHSPDAVKKKVKALSLLREFKELSQAP